MDDAVLMSAKLAEQGVRHRFDLWPGVVHGFLRFVKHLPPAVEAIRAAAEFVKGEAGEGARNGSIKIG